MKKVFLKGIKGGTGATSIVANLACALRKSDEDVIAIDLDPKSDLGCILVYRGSMLLAGVITCRLKVHWMSFTLMMTV